MIPQLVAVVGSCLFAYGRRVGELCRRDSDCESGLVCAEAEPGVSTRVCRPPVHQDKQYSEPCNMSSECDISRGLCCQLQRRHRQAPRKVTTQNHLRKSYRRRIYCTQQHFIAVFWVQAGVDSLSDSDSEHFSSEWLKWTQKWAEEVSYVVNQLT